MFVEHGDSIRLAHPAVRTDSLSDAFGNSKGRLSRRDCMRIARQFTAGNMTQGAQAPKARLKRSILKCIFNRPFGARSFSDPIPGVETPGYSHAVPLGQLFATGL